MNAFINRTPRPESPSTFSSSRGSGTSSSRNPVPWSVTWITSFSWSNSNTDVNFSFAPLLVAVLKGVHYAFVHRQADFVLIIFIETGRSSHANCQLPRRERCSRSQSPERLRSAEVLRTSSRWNLISGPVWVAQRQRISQLFLRARAGCLFGMFGLKRGEVFADQRFMRPP